MTALYSIHALPPQDLTDGDDLFSVDADGLFDATFEGGGGTDTLQLTGGGTFDVASATLSSIEILTGTAEEDHIVLNAEVLRGLVTIDGGGGTADTLRLEGGVPLDFTGKTITGFTRLDVITKRFDAIFDDKATALLVRAEKSEGDSLTLAGDIFTEAERAQMHAQGVDTIIDDSGVYTNAAPRISHLDGDHSYSAGGVAFLDRNGDAELGSIDDGFSSLTISYDSWEDPTGYLGIAVDGHLTLSDEMNQDSVIALDGTAFGTISNAEDGLAIAFSPNATAAQVQALLRALTYTNPDTDHTLIKTVGHTLVLADEGGRRVTVNVTVISGTAATQLFTGETDTLSGDGDDNVFGADKEALTAGDALEGGAGTDTLLLLNGGEFDLSRLSSLSGIETIRGSFRNDWIVMKAAQLTDVLTIDGGAGDDEGGMSDNLRIVGDTIDLRGKSFTNLGSIRLFTDHAVVTLDDKSVARLIEGSLTANDRVHLVGNVFTAAERAHLFRHHIETVSDASGVYANTAPVMGGLAGDRVVGTAGTAVFLDAGRNATVLEDDGLLSSLVVSVGNASAFDRLGIAVTQSVRLVGDRVKVGSVDIGFINATEQDGSSPFTVTFNEAATPERVQLLIRALTYTHTQTGFAGERSITLKLTDSTFHATEVTTSVTMEANAPPASIALSNVQVAELAPNGSTIGLLTATDPNEADAVTFQLRDDAGGRFALEGNRLVVKQGIRLDYEQAKSHLVTVRASDPQGLFADQSFTIAVTDVAREVVIGTDDRDVVVGGRGNDRFFGKLGSDVLTGGRGRDTFVFDTKIDRSRSQIDRITDFTAKDDRMDLAKAIFTKIGHQGVLKASAFFVGAKAHYRSDRVVYNEKTGALFYDADGSGKGAAIQFATLTNKAHITHKDFYLF